MKPVNWRQQAENLYFNNGKTIVQISKQLCISAVSLSKHFNSLPHYAAEKNQRIEQNKVKRKDYSREHKRISRHKHRHDAICGETLRREQRIAAIILSKERFFNE